MATRLRISIGMLMVVVGLVAVDFAIFRGLREAAGKWSELLIIVLPMINVLLLATSQIRRENGFQPAWLGFELGGWGMLLATTTLWSVGGDLVFWPMQPLELVVDSLAADVQITILIAAAVVFYTTAQILPALIVGRLNALYRVVIERR